MDGSKHTHLPQNKFLVTAFQLVGVIADSACIFCTENHHDSVLDSVYGFELSNCFHTLQRFMTDVKH